MIFLDCCLQQQRYPQLRPAFLHRCVNYICYIWTLKILTTIFPIYLLIIACMPCKDEKDGLINHRISIIKQTQRDAESSSETCSPFCTCTCCGSNISSAQFVSYKIEYTVTPQKEQLAFQSFSLQSVLNNIWQPPRM